MAESFGWLYGQVLKDRWNMNDAEITDLILNYRLPAYDGDRMLPINVEEEKEYMMHPDPYGAKDLDPTLKDRIDTCLFRSHDVECFEKENPELIRRVMGNESLSLRKKAREKKEGKLRPDQRHKIEVQKIASGLWEKQESPQTIAAMARDVATMADRDNLFGGRKYEVKTIRKWISPLAPDHSPGRRPEIK